MTTQCDLCGEQLDVDYTTICDNCDDGLAMDELRADESHG